MTTYDELLAERSLRRDHRMLPIPRVTVDQSPHPPMIALQAQADAWLDRIRPDFEEPRMGVWAVGRSRWRTHKTENPSTIPKGTSRRLMWFGALYRGPWPGDLLSDRELVDEYLGSAPRHTSFSMWISHVQGRSTSQISIDLCVGDTLNTDGNRWYHRIALPLPSIWVLSDTDWVVQDSSGQILVRWSQIWEELLLNVARTAEINDPPRLPHRPSHFPRTVLSVLGWIIGADPTREEGIRARR